MFLLFVLWFAVIPAYDLDATRTEFLTSMDRNPVGT